MDQSKVNKNINFLSRLLLHSGLYKKDTRLIENKGKERLTSRI